MPPKLSPLPQHHPPLLHTPRILHRFTFPPLPRHLPRHQLLELQRVERSLTGTRRHVRSEASQRVPDQEDFAVEEGVPR